MPHPPLSPPQRRQLWIRLAIRMGIVVAGLAISIWMVPPLLSLLAPLLCGWLVATLLNPLISSLQRQLGWGRGLFTLLVLGTVVAVLGGGFFALGYMVATQLSALLNGWETVLLQLTATMDHIDRLLDRFWQRIPPTLSQEVDSLYAQLLQWLRDLAPQLLERGARWAGQAMGGIPSFLVALIIFLLAAYFLATDYPNFTASRSPPEGDTALWSRLRQTALTAFGGYLKAQLLLSVGVFFILLAGFLIIRQPYGVLLALGLAVLDFIPILGAGTVMVPWAFLALMGGSEGNGLELLIIWGLVALFRRTSEPKFVGDQTGLSPILSLGCIYVGLQLGGILGMIFAPILALILINLIKTPPFQHTFQDIRTAIWDVSLILSGH